MFLFLIRSSRDKGTFRPVKNVPSEHRNAKLIQIRHETLSVVDVRTGVKLPPGENLNDWIAVAIVDFFNQLSILYAPVQEHCTEETCPEMSAGHAFKYMWQDADEYKKPTMLCAKAYISNVMEWTDSLLNNDKVFPSDPSVSYPKDIMNVMKNIFKRLFRIYAHIYHHHLDDIKRLGIDEQLNTSFRHFIFFSQEFKMIPPEQMQPLQDIIDQL